MTEEQARKRWCPMARVVEAGDGILHGPFNRYHSGADMGLDGGEACCLASDCMAWVERQGYDGRVEGRCGLVNE